MCSAVFAGCVRLHVAWALNRGRFDGVEVEAGKGKVHNLLRFFSEVMDPDEVREKTRHFNNYQLLSSRILVQAFALEELARDEQIEQCARQLHGGHRQKCCRVADIFQQEAAGKYAESHAEVPRGEN